MYQIHGELGSLRAQITHLSDQSAAQRKLLSDRESTIHALDRTVQSLRADLMRCQSDLDVSVSEVRSLQTSLANFTSPTNNIFKFRDDLENRILILENKNVSRPLAPLAVSAESMPPGSPLGLIDEDPDDEVDVK